MQDLASQHSIGLAGEPGQNVNFVKLLRHVGSNGRACVIGGRKARQAMRMRLIRVWKWLNATVRSWIATSNPSAQAGFHCKFMGLLCSQFFKKQIRRSTPWH